MRFASKFNKFSRIDNWWGNDWLNWLVDDQKVDIF